MFARFHRFMTVVFALLLTSPCFSMVPTLITGDKGNKPIPDPGWAKGSAAVFNATHRIAWWEGPPLGGGEFHSECQGNATAFNEILVAFQKIEVPKKRLVVSDGVGSSFWLDPNHEHRGDPAVEMDWSFTVWQTERWKIQKELPAGLSSVRGIANGDVPAPEIHLYVGGAIAWKDVIVPDGIEVVDRRLEAHGFSISDGHVLQGVVRDANGKPLMATIRLEHIEPGDKGGYKHTEVAQTKTNAMGEWNIKNVGEQWCQVIAEADGYLPRIFAYVHYDKQPGWESFDTSLSKLSSVRGRILDELNQPLAGVNVRLSDLALESQSVYKTTHDEGVTTERDGTFVIQAIEGGKCRIWLHRDSYVRAGLGESVIAPKSDVELTMSKSATLIVDVLFPKQNRKGEYLIGIAPEGGEKVGSWGGSASIDTENRTTFKHVPPGKYFIHGHPNPSSDSEKTKEQLVELKPGEELKVELVAK